MTNVTVNTSIVRASVQSPTEVVARVQNTVANTVLVGIPGIQGAQGSVWLTSAGVPDDANGRNGDMNLANNGAVYQKVDGAWVFQTNISGTVAGSFRFVQAAPATVWTINHDLGFRPNVFVTDTNGDVCEGAVANPTVNQVIITFSAAFAGEARLS